MALLPDPPDEGLPAMSMEQGICTCGHDRESHFRERGNCMASTEAETWACTCGEFRELTDERALWLAEFNDEAS